ncbi:hypothetical protein C0991_000840 [Blastosporella zonata]|nr:hypothetical protein C0991_000840 [Blastosporella zonata]
MHSFAAIRTHTTASSPRPHILYVVQVTLSENDPPISARRRYSDFVVLHETLKDPYSLPPKRLFSTVLFPSAWVDDELINERKTELTRYINNLLQSSDYKESPALLKFLTNTDLPTPHRFNIEDAVPSTLSGKAAKAALELSSGNAEAAAKLIAASYYVDWAADSFPPESLNFSKFDILFFAFATASSSFTLAFDSGSQAILKRLATAAHKSGFGTKVVLSVAPASKLLLGLPLYGYVSKSSKKALTGSLLPSPDMVLLQKNNEAPTSANLGDAGMHFLNGAHMRTKKLSRAVAASANLTSYWGQQIAFSDIVQSGALVKNSAGNYGQGGGFTMAWDDCSDTPTTVVTYDDTYSLADKAQFAKNNGMAGCFTWSLDQVRTFLDVQCTLIDAT